jgi:hypothetical protein
LFEGGDTESLLAQLNEMAQSGVKILVLTALNDRGTPVYDINTAKKIADMGITCCACTPGHLPVLLEGIFNDEYL